MSHPVLRFRASYVQDAAINVYVELNGDTLGHSSLDLSLEEWHGIELLARAPFVEVETSVES